MYLHFANHVLADQTKTIAAPSQQKKETDQTDGDLFQF